jgi:Ion channel
MWNMVITMTTIGYGDYSASSHMGRLIAILIAYWGVFYVSLFIVALNNMLNFTSPQNKAFMLLTRLCAKEQLRTEAAGMLSAAYRMKLYKRKGSEKYKAKLLQEDRKYRYHDQEFKKVNRQIRNINDPDADMETLKNGIEMLVDDVSLIRMAQYFIYHDSRKLKKNAKSSRKE